MAIDAPVDGAKLSVSGAPAVTLVLRLSDGAKRRSLRVTLNGHDVAGEGRRGSRLLTETLTPAQGLVVGHNLVTASVDGPDRSRQKTSSRFVVVTGLGEGSPVYPTLNATGSQLVIAGGGGFATYTIITSAASPPLHSEVWTITMQSGLSSASATTSQGFCGSPTPGLTSITFLLGT